MPGLTLLVGPPGCGKTERLVERAAARYRADRFTPTLVLVPTARHADQFRRRLVAACGVALNLDVATLALFARRHVDDNVPPSEVASELLRRVTRERVASGGADRFRPIVETPGLHTLVGAAVGELLAAEIEPDELVEAAGRAGSADHMALADIYAAYRSALAARGWRDPREAPTLAAEAIAGRDDLPRLVLVDSFELLNPRELRLVAALAERSDVVITLDPGGERARALDRRAPRGGRAGARPRAALAADRYSRRPGAHGSGRRGAAAGHRARHQANPHRGRLTAAV